MTKESLILEKVEDVEVQLLIEGIYQRYGYDFRDYSRAHMKRRILHRLGKENLNSVSRLQEKVLHDQAFFKSVLPEFSINVTEMFRDPEFFLFFRERVVPYLATLPQIKIWHAGCASGEEVYSMAILLKEAGLYDKAVIYGTDFNDKILKVAAEGEYPIGAMSQYTKNYMLSGGTRTLNDYYEAKYDHVLMDKSLRENVSFLNHNLVTDEVFGEMDLILCRNVLIYFNRDLQNRVLKLFEQSLSNKGILCLGTKETIDYSEVSGGFTALAPQLKVYKKKK